MGSSIAEGGEDFPVFLDFGLFDGFGRHGLVVWAVPLLRD